MALINDFNQAGDGIVVSQSRDVRRYRVGEADDFIDYIEVTVQETREWVGLTFAAAKSQVDANIQPAENDSSFSYMLDEDNRIVKSYKLQRTYERKTVSTAASSPPPTVGGITWSTGSANVASFPFSVTMTSANAADKIWYRIDGMDSSGTYVVGTFVEGSSNNVTVSVNTDAIRGNGGIHKRVRIVAEVRRTTLSGNYVGPRSEVILTRLIPNFGNATFSPAGGSSTGSAEAVSFPVSVTVTAPSGATRIFAQTSRWNGSALISTSGMLDRGTSPASIALDNVAYDGTNKLSGLAAFPAVVIDGIYYRNGQSQFSPTSPPAASTAPQRFYKN